MSDIDADISTVAQDVARIRQRRIDLLAGRVETIADWAAYADRMHAWMTANPGATFDEKAVASNRIARECGVA